MFWIVAIVVTAIACAALYYAAVGRAVNATPAGVGDATAAHFRLQLKEIDGDIRAGRMAEPEGLAAKGEMARELLRLEAEAKKNAQANGVQRPIFIVSILLVAALSLGAYAFIGNPDLPSMPLAKRASPEELTLEAAVTQIEARLVETPNDARAWKALAPAYLDLGRFEEAQRARRQIIALEGPTADNETDLAEALMFANNGESAGEAIALLTSAAERDPAHVRSRFYLAGEATQSGDYAAAVPRWNEVIALAKGDEPWLKTARDGLAVATAGLNGGGGIGVQPKVPDGDAINNMVEGLATRLANGGGTVAEWTQLVRSRLVLGQKEQAQIDYDTARAAYPDDAERSALDQLASENGLVTTKATN